MRKFAIYATLLLACCSILTLSARSQDTMTPPGQTKPPEDKSKRPSPPAHVQFQFPDGKMLTTIQLAVDAGYRERKRDELETAKENAIRLGIPVSNRPPTGYRKGDERRLEPNPAVAPVIRQLFEMRADGELVGVIVYHIRGSAMAFLHTETEDRFRGQGVASHLIRSSLDAARERHLSVLPYCPYVQRWLAEHPDYADLVPEDRRPAFGL